MSGARKAIGWIREVWKKEDADARVIQLQKYIIMSLILMCMILTFGWMRAPSKLTIYIPPDIQNGATLKTDSVPQSFVYSFAYEIWQQINTWPKEGTEDYQKNIHEYWSYVTPKFKSDLLDEYEELKKSGQLQRVRFLQGISGAAYDASKVKKLSADTWQVDLNMRLTELRNNQIVKDVEILYPLIITRVNMSIKSNPYGLAVSGFERPPVRTTNYIKE